MLLKKMELYTPTNIFDLFEAFDTLDHEYTNQSNNNIMESEKYPRLPDAIYRHECIF